ncbi:MAG: peptide deformylase [Pseudomonadota bacterium]
MAIRPIVIHPDPLLAQVSQPVEAFDAALGSLIEDMFDTMYAAPGRGLAAVQVGVLKRLFIMDATWKDGDKSPRIFINPVITDHSAHLATNLESCLSIPDRERKVARPAEVSMRWQDGTGAACEGHFQAFEAVCVQHEFDHLDGKLILDHPEAP